MPITIPNYSKVTTVTVPSISELCQLKQRVEKDYDASNIYHVSSSLSSAEKQHIGSVTGWIILKDGYKRGGFHAEGDMCHQETCDLALGLFDDKGVIKSKYIGQTAHRGTGVWGQELSTGGLTLTFNWTINRDFQRKGMGKWLLSKHFELPQISQYCSFAYVQPSYTGQDKEDMNKQQWQAAFDGITHLFRKLGYRRVGLSHFLCLPLSSQPSHPAFSLPIDEDGEIPSVEMPEEPESANPLFEIDNTAISRNNPLHHSIMNDPEPVALAKLQAAYARNPDIANKKDLHNALLIHMAAHQAYPTIIEYLVSIGSPLHQTTFEGDTPLECLEDIIASNREFVNCFQIPRKALSDNQARSLYILRQHCGDTVPEARDGLEPWQLLRFDCSCGECIEGFLSKRMLFRIVFAAHVSGDTLRDEADASNSGEPLELWLGEEFIPPQLFKPNGISPSQARGLSEMYMAIGNLAHRRVKPNLAAIESELLLSQHVQDVKCFKRAGGTVEIALNAVMAIVWREGPEGDNVFEFFYPDDGTEDSDEFYKLPECYNDNAWGIVREQLGTSYSPKTYEAAI